MGGGVAVMVRGPRDSDDEGVWPRGFATIVFDCDSTLAAIEGIDELAGPWAAEIRALTDAAMDGSIALEEVYGRRLEIIRPDHQRVDVLGRQYIERLVADARETIGALLWLGKDVRIVSGGLKPPVTVLARELGIGAGAVAAVGIEFNPDGTYADFERTSPLARAGGKAQVVRDWELTRPTMLVGDGATDLEAREVVDLFVAYMGVVYRENVAAGAEVVLKNESLSPVLSIATTPGDRERLRASPWRETLARGDHLLRSDLSNE
jgi:phosphoserine phosphatase